MMDEVGQKLLETKEESFEEDARLASRASAGDPAAQRELAKRLMPHIRRMMSYMTKDVHIVDDLTQSALVRILLRVENYKGNGPLESWAIKVSTRTALNEIKKLSRQRRVPQELSEARSPFPMAQDEASLFMMKQKMALLLSKLKEKYRIPLVLKYVEGYSVKEIASLLSIPENTVRGRLGIAKGKLRGSLEREPGLMEQMLGRKES